MPKAYTVKDKYFKKAKQEGFRARSVYKLQDIDEKFQIIKRGIKVIDIGAAPGSWLQYVSSRIGEKGRVLGLDLQPIDFVADNVTTRICDITDKELVQELIGSLGLDQADLIISDLAPNTTGIKYVDQMRSVQLNQTVFEIAKHYLKENGKLVMKVFSGESLDSLLKDLKRFFRSVRVFKSEASRDRSSEVYIICS